MRSFTKRHYAGLFLPVLILLIFTMGLTYQLDPDLGWHLYLGAYAIQHHTLVTSLVGYTFFAASPLPDHEWLSDILMSAAYAHVGYIGLIVGSALLALGVLLITYRAALQKGASSLAAGLATTVVMYGIGMMYGVREQLLLLVGIAVLANLGRRLISLPYRCLAYGTLFALGMNLHGGFIPLAVVPAILESQIFSNEKNRRKALFGYAAVGLSILAALCTSPYGFSLWELARQYMVDSSYLQYINEWQPLFSSGLFSVGPVLAIGSVALLFLGRCWRSMSRQEMLLLAVFLLLSVRMQRFLPSFLILAAPQMAEGADRCLTWLKRNGVMLQSVLGASFLAVLYVGASTEWNLIRLNPDPRDAETYPKAAMSTLTSIPSCQEHLLNPYEWGGYILEFNPPTHVFIDGRGPQLQIAQGMTLIQLYEKMYSADSAEKLGPLLRTYDIQCVLVSKAKRKKTQTALEDLGWNKAYEDGTSLIYVQ